MSPDTATLTRCPTCGVQLQRTDLSLCAYCAAPLRMGAPAAPPDDETQRLLQKIQAHASYAAALQWSPVEPEVEELCGRLTGLGTAAFIGALLAVLVSALQSGGSFFTRISTLVAATLLLTGVALLSAVSGLRARSKHRAMLRRPARVLDRRSQTELTDKVGATTYYFQLRFADGSQGEFRMPGRGTMYEPPTVGASGLAYTRASDLIEFKRF